jgi:radial spoke head protein 4A
MSEAEVLPPLDTEVEPIVPVDIPVVAPIVEAPVIVKKKPTFLPEDTEFNLAKSFLLSKTGSKHPVSLYDHMTRVVQHCLEQRTQNAVDSFEPISFELKRNRANLNIDSFATAQSAKQLSLDKAKKLLKYLRPDTAEVTDLGDIPDMLDLSRIWEWAGVTFGQETTFLLMLAIKKLVEEKSLKSARLWGKIIGLKANYIIVEGELKEGIADEEDALINKPQKPAEKDESKSKKTKPAKQLTRESKSGTNKYIYFVCSDGFY